VREHTAFRRKYQQRRLCAQAISRTLSKLTRLRARVKRNDITSLASNAIDKDLKMQLRTARDVLLEAVDMMTPASDHKDQELRIDAAPATQVAAAAAQRLIQRRSSVHEHQPAPNHNDRKEVIMATLESTAKKPAEGTQTVMSKQ
jgi:hypothetical protein